MCRRVTTCIFLVIITGEIVGTGGGIEVFTSGGIVGAGEKYESFTNGRIVGADKEWKALWKSTNGVGY